jgi:malate dehydrogenase
MERAELLKDNGKIFVEQGRAIDAVAAADCRVAVVGNPCNTNCMIAAMQCRRLGPERFTAMTRLDQNRAQTQLALKAGVPVAEVTDIIIYGNHSPTMYPDFFNARIGGRPATQVIKDEAWLKNTFIPSVGKRGATIIEARGASSAASAANALVDQVRALITPGSAIHSLAVKSDGAYGFSEGVWASVPVRTTGYGTYELARQLAHNDFARQKIAASNAELVSERETVRELLG